MYARGLFVLCAVLNAHAVGRKCEISIVRSSAAEYLTFAASIGDDKDSIEMRYEDKTIWLTQRMMAALCDVDVRTIYDHIKKYILILNWNSRQLSENIGEFSRKAPVRLPVK